MEVNYLLIIVTTAIACCIIFGLNWKNKRDLRNFKREKFKSDIRPATHKDVEDRL